jgi:hypothetical protein
MQALFKEKPITHTILLRPISCVTAIFQQQSTVPCSKPINSQIGEAIADQPIEAIFEPMPANLTTNYYLKWGNGERV